MKNYKTSRKPECSRCKNHNIHVGIKGHKRFCPYGFCKCAKCILTAERQRIIAKQVKMRREQAENEEMEKARDSKEQTICEDKIDEDKNKTEDGVENESLTSQNSINDNEILTSNIMQQDSNNDKFQVIFAMDSLMSILNISDNNAEITALYSLLKRCGFNVTETYNKIVQAQQELKLLCDISSLMSVRSTNTFDKPAHCRSCPSDCLSRILTVLPHTSDDETEENNTSEISQMEENFEDDNDLPELLRIVPPP